MMSKLEPFSALKFRGSPQQGFCLLMTPRNTDTTDLFKFKLYCMLMMPTVNSAFLIKGKWFRLELTIPRLSEVN